MSKITNPKHLSKRLSNKNRNIHGSNEQSKSRRISRNNEQIKSLNINRSVEQIKGKLETSAKLTKKYKIQEASRIIMNK